ncbi:MAG: hypothetical protein ACD_22C00283G0001 [uncultured bacterium]|nr:MAG: hypothetical protein ACD_22C00283G0001 [uncultured bacterium]
MSSGGHNKTHGSVESSRRIDIRTFQKAGVLKNSCYYNSSWTRNGRDMGSMKFEHLKGNDFITAMYTFTPNSTGEKENRNDIIMLGYITTGYGERAYFVCPKCGELRTILSFYNGGFNCRVCARLNYQSSQATKWDKTEMYFARIKKILERLKHTDTKDYDVWYVPKPKRMRYYTYERLIKQLHVFQQERNEWFNFTMVKKFGKHFNFERGLRNG